MNLLSFDNDTGEETAEQQLIPIRQHSRLVCFQLLAVHFCTIAGVEVGDGDGRRGDGDGDGGVAAGGSGRLATVMGEVDGWIPL